MERGRQTILSLVAVGRITPHEAERLLAAWDAGREELWMLAACALIGVIEWGPALIQFAHQLLPVRTAAVHHAVAAITYWMGGML